MRLLKMKRPKYIGRIENIYFLAPIGKLLRSLTIKLLLARLDRMELEAKWSSRAANDN